jgi:hypothetical protein
MTEEKLIPLINIPVIESLWLTTRFFDSTSCKIIGPILTFDTHFLSNLYLEHLDFGDEQVSVLLLGHSFPVLRHLTLYSSTLTSSFLLSLMSCGPLYDAARNRRPLLEEVYCCECSLVAHLNTLSNGVVQPMSIFLAEGFINSRTLQDVDMSLEYLCITSGCAKELLDSGIVDDLEKLTELYGACCKWPSQDGGVDDSHATGQTQ